MGKPFFPSYLGQKRGSWTQAFLAETVETRNKNGDVTENIQCIKNFPQRPACFVKKALEAKYVELFGNESVYEYYRLKVLITLEEVNISVVEKKQNLYEKNFNDEANPSGVVNFHSMQMSFAISMHACILSVMIGMTRHVHHFLALWQ